ncbi:MAG: hypothetical protein KIT43_01255 [Bauldia sp.]|nr:hypothetical protein [Bauldia sp.]MCW5716298.1 hypothetical protein [Bauldia sp.]
MCCAGVTLDRQWRRLFPIRFRHLSGDASFSRWDRISFTHRSPSRDTRAESCHVFEDSISKEGTLPAGERSRLLEPMILGSASAATNAGMSLAIIRPRNTRFYWRAKKPGELSLERDAYKRSAGQVSMFDDDLAALEPSPYHFRFRFDDDGGRHDYANGDWEAHAMFWRRRLHVGEAEALREMSATFNDEYPRRGMAFAIGNQAKRPQVWQLLGVIRLDPVAQAELPL